MTKEKAFGFVHLGLEQKGLGFSDLTIASLLVMSFLVQQSVDLTCD